MNIQQAYNKGLSDSEDLVLRKLEAALNGIDEPPFLNPKMESLRKRVMESSGNSSKDFKRLIKNFSKGKPCNIKIDDPELLEMKNKVERAVISAFEMSKNKTVVGRHFKRVILGRKQIETSTKEVDNEE